MKFDKKKFGAVIHPQGKPLVNTIKYNFTVVTVIVKT